MKNVTTEASIRQKIELLIGIVRQGQCVPQSAITNESLKTLESDLDLKISWLLEELKKHTIPSDENGMLVVLDDQPFNIRWPYRTDTTGYMMYSHSVNSLKLLDYRVFSLYGVDDDDETIVSPNVFFTLPTLLRKDSTEYLPSELVKYDFQPRTLLFGCGVALRLSEELSSLHCGLISSTMLVDANPQLNMMGTQESHVTIDMCDEGILLTYDTSVEIANVTLTVPKEYRRSTPVETIRYWYLSLINPMNKKEYHHV